MQENSTWWILKYYVNELKWWIWLRCFLYFVAGCQSERPYYFQGTCLPECPSTFYVVNTTVDVPNEQIPSDNSTDIVPTMANLMAKINESQENADAGEGVTVSPPPDFTPVVYQACMPCPRKCANCTGPTISECISCFDGYTLTNETCLRTSNFIQDHMLVSVTMAVSVCALLVFFLVFGLLQLCTVGCRKRQGYVLADLDEELPHFNKQNGSSEGSQLKRSIPGHAQQQNGISTRISKAELERRNLLQDSESELENEVFVYDKRKPDSNIW